MPCFGLYVTTSQVSVAFSCGYSIFIFHLCIVSESPVYYFGFFRNKNVEENADLKLILLNTNTEQASFTVAIPGIEFIKSDTIPANEQKIVDIPSDAEILSYDDENKGIYLTTSDCVIAIGQNIKGDNFDTFTLHPVSHLHVDNYTYYGISTTVVNSDASSILVVGTADNTMMELKVTQKVMVKIGGYHHVLYSGLQYSFVIKRLQTVYMYTKADLSGSKITTDKPVSVFSGHRHGHVEVWLRSGGYLAEQIPPTAFWDKVHYFANTGQSVLTVLAAKDDTNVDIHCSGTKTSYNIVKEGGSFETIFSAVYDTEYCAVHSDKPVLVAHLGALEYVGSDVVGDPMMVTVLGASQYTSKLDSSTLNPVVSSKIYHHYINLLVLAEYYQPDQIHLKQKGETQTLDNGKWKPIEVDNVTEAYGLRLSIQSGPFTITHDDTAAKMTVVLFGTGDRYGGYGHSAQFSGIQGTLRILFALLCMYIKFFSVK